MAVHKQHRAFVYHQFCVFINPEVPSLDAIHVIGNHAHTMRIMPFQVCFNQVFSHLPCPVFGSTRLFKYFFYKLSKSFVVDQHCDLFHPWVKFLRRLLCLERSKVASPARAKTTNVKNRTAPVFRTLDLRPLFIHPGFTWFYLVLSSLHVSCESRSP